MNCTKCHYLLFGVSSGRCPECGVLFSATDFSFERGSVHFLCHHCQQSYLGTDSLGLPHPRTFTCVRCKNAVNAAQMAVRPLREGVVGEPLRFGAIWERRRDLGRIRAFLHTMTAVCTRPADFFRAAFASDRAGAVIFGVIAGILALAFWVTIFLLACYLLGYSPTIAGSPSRVTFQLILTFLAFVGAVLVWMYLYAYSICIALRLMGQPGVDAESVVQVVAYANAVLPAIPPICIFWHIAVVIVGLKELLSIGRGRAIIAAMLLPLLTANMVILPKLL